MNKTIFSTLLSKLAISFMLLALVSCVQNGTSVVNFDAPEVASGGVNLQFVNEADADGNNISVTWSAFSGYALYDHQLFTYTDSACSTGEVDHGRTGSSVNYSLTTIKGLPSGQYWGKVVAIGSAGRKTEGECSTDSIIIDTVAPAPTGAADSITFNPSGGIVADSSSVDISWSKYTDSNIKSYKIYTHQLADCSDVGVLHSTYVASASDPATISKSSAITGLGEGHYYGRVVAVDLAGNETSTACSTDSFYVDNVSPVENALTADPTFNFGTGADGTTLLATSSGSGFDITWNAFVDGNLADHTIRFHTLANCSDGPYATYSSGSGLNTATSVTPSVALVEGTPYYVSIIATDIAGNTVTSSCSTNTVLYDATAPSALAAPAFVTTADQDGSNISVTWTAPAVEANLNHYRIKTYVGAGCAAGEVDHGSTGAILTTDSTLISGLADNPIYTFKVVAVDKAGNETESACSSNTLVVDSIAPTAPANSKVVFTDSYTVGNNIELSWNTFTDATTLSYRLDLFSDNTCSTLVATGVAASSPNNTALTGLTGNNVELWGRVTAIDAAGNQTAGECTTDDSIILDSVAPVATGIVPSFGAAGDIDGLAVAVSWSSFTDTGVGIGSYEVFSYEDAGCTTNEASRAVVASPTVSTLITLPTSAPSISYWVKVTGTDLAGNSIDSSCSAAPIVIDNIAPTAPTAPIFVSTTVNSLTGISLSWTAATDNIANHEILLYNAAACGGTVTNLGMTGSSTSTALIDIPAEGTYSYKVVAYDVAGQSATSVCSNDLTVDTTPPVYDSGVALNFTSSDAPPVDPQYDNDGSAMAAYFDATIMTGGVQNYEVYLITGTTCTVGTGVLVATIPYAAGTLLYDSFSSLAEGDYIVYVKGIDAAGNSAYSNCSSVLTVDSTSPSFASAPYFKQMYSDGASVDLEWDSATETANSRYEVLLYQDVTCSTPFAVAPYNTAFTVTDAGTLQHTLNITSMPEDQYWYRVTAIDKAGNSTVSSCSSSFVNTASSFNNLMVDATPPDGSGVTVSEVVEVAGPPAYDSDSILTIQWDANFIDTTSSATGITYQYYLYASNAACAADATFSSALQTVDPSLDATATLGVNRSTFSVASDGTYSVALVASDQAGNKASVCSPDILVDTSDPVAPSGLNFSVNASSTGNVDLSWTAATDSGTLASHQVELFTDSGCTAAVAGTQFVVSAVATSYSFVGVVEGGPYYAKVTGTDSAGRTAETCSTATYYSDATNPGGANLATFTDSYDSDGLGILLDWADFTDSLSGILKYEVQLYNVAGCASGLQYTFDTGSSVSSYATDSGTTVADGTYYAVVRAYDLAMNYVDSGCSADSIVVDKTAPDFSASNISFDTTPSGTTTSAVDTDGNAIDISWDESNDPTSGVATREIVLYSHSTAPTALEMCSGTPILTSASAVAPVAGDFYDNVTITGLADKYYSYRIKATDNAGNIGYSSCSSNYLIVDRVAPSGIAVVPYFSAPVSGVSSVGNDVEVSWGNFSEPNIQSYSVDLYLDQNCTIASGIPSQVATSPATLNAIGTDGEYWVQITATDQGGLTGTSLCSTGTMIVDTAAPVDNIADPQFAEEGTTDGTANLSWTAFSDATLSQYLIQLYTDSACTTTYGTTYEISSSLTSISLSSLGDNQEYWVVVTAKDSAGRTTSSSCSTDSVVIDSTPPAAPGTPNLQFISPYDDDGMSISVTWNHFTDTFLKEYRVKFYPQNGCLGTPQDFSSSASASNFFTSPASAIPDGTYWLQVTAVDRSGNTTSICTSGAASYPSAPTPPFQQVIVDTSAPSSSTTVQPVFASTTDNDGDGIDLSWGGFTTANDNILLYTATLYTDSSCTTATAYAATSSSKSVTFNGVADGTYYASVVGEDMFGRTSITNCSSNTVTIDSIPPTAAVAAPTFNGVSVDGGAKEVDADGNNVSVTWDEFTGASSYQLMIYSDASCSSLVSTFTSAVTPAASMTDSSVIDGLSEGQYWVKVKGIDSFGNSVDGLCSTESIYIDINSPTLTSGTISFSDTFIGTGVNTTFSWSGFSDTTFSIYEYSITYYNDASCTSAYDTLTLPAPGFNTVAASGPSVVTTSGNPLPATTFTVSFPAEGTYRAIVTATDLAGNSVSSPCSSDAVVVDGTAPTDPSWVTTFPMTYPQGNNVPIDWSDSVDSNLWKYRLRVFEGAGCSGTMVIDTFVSGATSNTTLNGLVDGTSYSVEVTAWDYAAAVSPAGHVSNSICSAGEILIGSPVLQVSSDGATFDTTAVYDFGSQSNNSTQTITVRNSSALIAAQVALGISTVPASSTYFTITTDNCTGVTLAAGAQCTIDVQFNGLTAPSGSSYIVLLISGGIEGSVSATLNGSKP